MQPLSVIPGIDVPGHVSPCVFAGRVDGAVYSFVLQGCKEGFGHCIVVADSGSADRLTHVEFGEGSRELARRVVGGFNWS